MTKFAWLRRPLFLLFSAALAAWIWVKLASHLLPADQTLGFTLTVSSPGIALSAGVIAALALLTAALGLLCCRVSRMPLLSVAAVLAGPAALAISTGSMRDRLLDLHDSIPNRYPGFALEAAYLQSLFIVIAIITSLATRKNTEHPNPVLNPPTVPSVLTALMTAMLGFIFVCFLVQNDQPAQVCAGLVGAFAIATLIANLTVPAYNRILAVLISPCLVAIVGYLQTRFAYASTNAYLEQLFAGRLLGTALPLPLQYISFGTLGVLLGTGIAEALTSNTDNSPT